MNQYIIILYFLKKTMLRHVSGFLLHQTSWAGFVKTWTEFAKAFVYLFVYAILDITNKALEYSFWATWGIFCSFLIHHEIFFSSREGYRLSHLLLKLKVLTPSRGATAFKTLWGQPYVLDVISPSQKLVGTNIYAIGGAP